MLKHQNELLERQKINIRNYFNVLPAGQVRYDMDLDTFLCEELFQEEFDFTVAEQSSFTGTIRTARTFQSMKKSPSRLTSKKSVGFAGFKRLNTIGPLDSMAEIQQIEEEDSNSMKDVSPKPIVCQASMKDIGVNLKHLNKEKLPSGAPKPALCKHRTIDLSAYDHDIVGQKRSKEDSELSADDSQAFLGDSGVFEFSLQSSPNNADNPKLFSPRKASKPVEVLAEIASSQSSGSEEKPVRETNKVDLMLKPCIEEVLSASEDSISASEESIFSSQEDIEDSDSSSESSDSVLAQEAISLKSREEPYLAEGEVHYWRAQIPENDTSLSNLAEQNISAHLGKSSRDSPRLLRTDRLKAFLPKHLNLPISSNSLDKQAHLPNRVGSEKEIFLSPLKKQTHFEGGHNSIEISRTQDISRSQKILNKTRNLLKNPSLASRNTKKSCKHSVEESEYQTPLIDPKNIKNFEKACLLQRSGRQPSSSRESPSARRAFGAFEPSAQVKRASSIHISDPGEDEIKGRDLVNLTMGDAIYSGMRNSANLKHSSVKKQEYAFRSFHTGIKQHEKSPKFVSKYLDSKSLIEKSITKRAKNNLSSSVVRNESKTHNRFNSDKPSMSQIPMEKGKLKGYSIQNFSKNPLKNPFRSQVRKGFTSAKGTKNDSFQKILSSSVYDTKKTKKTIDDHYGASLTHKKAGSAANQFYLENLYSRVKNQRPSHPNISAGYIDLQTSQLSSQGASFSQSKPSEPKKDQKKAQKPQIAPKDLKRAAGLGNLSPRRSPTRQTSLELSNLLKKPYIPLPKENQAFLPIPKTSTKKTQQTKPKKQFQRP